MSFEPFTGELDKPEAAPASQGFVEFNGELDKPEKFSPAKDSQAAYSNDSPDQPQEVVTSARPWQGGSAGRGTNADPRRLDVGDNFEKSVRTAAVSKAAKKLKAINPGATDEQLQGMADAGYNPQTGNVELGTPGVQNTQEFMDASRNQVLENQKRERIQRKMDESPVTNALASGLATNAIGLINAPQALANAPIEIYDRIGGAISGEKLDTPKVPKWWFTKEAMDVAASAMPTVANKDVATSWKDGDFGTMILTNMAANAPSSAMSIAAMFAPPLRAAVLPMMGASATGTNYAQGDSAVGSVLKGGVEVGTEMLPLHGFDKIREVLDKMPLPLQKQALAIAGQKVLKSGATVSTTALTNFIEEAAAQVGGNIVDRTIEGKKTAMDDGVLKAGLIGAASGGAHAMPHVAQIAAAPGSREGMAAQEMASAMSSDLPETAIVPQTDLANTAPAMHSFADPNGPASKAGITPIMVPIAPAQNVSTTDAPGRLDQRAADVGGNPVQQGVGATGSDAYANPGMVDSAAAPGGDGATNTPVSLPAQEPTAAIKPVAATPDSELLSRIPTEKVEPSATIAGADGSGFARGDAKLQQEAMTKRHPGMEWRIEPLDNGKFQVAGYAVQGETNGRTTAERNANASTDEGRRGSGNEGNADARAIQSVADQAGRAVPSTVAGDVRDTTASRARRELQDRLDRAHAADPQNNPKVTLGEPDAKVEAQLHEAARATAEAFGVSSDVVAFTDNSPQSVNGFEQGGKVYINTKGLTHNALKTTWHETHHVLQSRAEADDRAGRTNTPAQRYRDSVDALFDDMSEEGKRSYIENFLYQDSLKGVTGAKREAKVQELLKAPLTRKEMVADFVGNRATDRKFISDLAKADPKGFEAFAQRWLKIINDLMAQLRGNGKNKESAAVDRYVADLNKARMVLRDAMVAHNRDMQIAKEKAKAFGKESKPEAQVTEKAGDTNFLRRQFKSVDEFDASNVDYSNELGNFNLDAANQDLDFPDLGFANEKLDKVAERKKQEELAAELRNSSEKRKSEAPSPLSIDKEQMAVHGLFPEKAMPFGKQRQVYGEIQIDHSDDYKESQGGRIAEYGPADGWKAETEHVFVDSPRHAFTQDGAINHYKAQVSAPLIHDAGYDLATAYRRGTVLKLAQVWRNLAKKSGVFRLPGSARSKDFAAVASDMKAMEGFDLKMYGNGKARELVLKDKSTGYEYHANFRFMEPDRFQVCTLGLAGSDQGSNFYAVASEWARLNGYQFQADRTLSSINTARRTEQAVSYALKTGDTGVVLPGIQNRVYGFNESPKTQEDHDLNLSRLLLAGMRNAMEIDPEIRRLRYDPSEDKFLTKDGSDAEDVVKAFLENRDARAYGMGRTTLARAVITSEILTGTFDPSKVEEFKAPVAYLRKQGVEPLSEEWGESGAMVPKLKEFLGNSVMQENGTPTVMYHGTARDVTEFKPKQAGAIFLTSDPTFATDFAGHSAEWMARHYDEVLTPEQVEQAKAAAIKTVMADKSVKMSERKEMAESIRSGKPTGAAQDVMMDAATALMPSAPNVMPLVVRAENPFDFENKRHRDDVIAQMFANAESGTGAAIATNGSGSKGLMLKNRAGAIYTEKTLDNLMQGGAWDVIEEPEVQQAIRDLDHDSFWVMENGRINLAVYDPGQVKSAIGNNGDYDKDNPDVRYNRKQLDDYISARQKSMPLVTPQSVQDKDIETAAKAMKAAIEEIKNGNRDTLPVPIGRIPHALTMLRVQSQMMKIDTSIVNKAFVNEDKHAADFDGIDPEDVVRAIYNPALILKTAKNDEFEIVTGLKTSNGPIIVPIRVNTTSPGGDVKHAAIMSMYSRPVAGAGRSIANRVIEGNVIYADPEQAQIALTGRGEAGVIGGRYRQQGSTVESQKFSAPPPAKGSTANVSDREISVKPLNPNFVGWDRVRAPIMDGIADKKIKTDVDLMKWIGDNYKPGSSDGGWGDAPAFSRKQEPARAKGMKEESWFMRQRRRFQDQFIQIREVQDMLTARGGEVGEAQDVYRAEERMHGRAQELLNDFAQNQIEPLVKKAAEYGVGLDELALYAYAKHAKERNAYIKSINPKIGDAGSGMSNDHADNIIQLVQQSGDAAHFDELHDDLMGITATTRRVLLDEGLITPEEYKGWEDLYDNYVPLRGFEDVNHETATPMRGTGRGFSMTGKESVKALGRTSKAGDILENIIRDYERAVIRSEKNAVAKTFLDLVTTNPDPDLWEVQPVKMNRSFNKASGMVLQTTAPDTGDETIAVKVGGQQVRIKIHDPLVLRAMKLASKDETSQLERILANTLGTYTNLMRNTLTRFNPIFGAINAVRDSQMGLVSIYDELGGEGAKLYLKHLGPALAASFRKERGKADPANKVMDRWIMEMRFAGGTTGGYHMRDTSEITDAMRTLMLQAGASPNTKMEAVRASLPYQKAATAMKWLEIIGSTSEDAARVAAYRTAREMKKTPAQAASIAKNLTTNFNRKGEWGTTLNSMYLFFNAGVQGTTRVLEALNNPKVRYMMAGLTGAAMALALMNAGAGDDDDGQNYWDKIPDFEKERNLIFMLPPGVEMDGSHKVGTQGRYVKIPMPYGINVFAVLGNQLADLARYTKDPSRGVKPLKAGINLASSIFGAINPFGGSVDPTKPAELGLALSPTAADLGIQLMAGVNSFGRPVGPEKSPFDDKPDSENFSARQAGTASQKVARWLNSVTGGTEGRSGAIDIMPGTIDNIVRNTTGGLGVFLADTFVNLPSKLMSPVEPTNRDIPLWRNFYGKIDEVTDQGLFYERRAEVTKEAKSALREMKLGLDVNYDKESIAKQSLAKVAESYTKWMTALRKEEIAIAEDDKLSNGEKMVKRREIEKQRAEAVKSFNTVYNEEMKALAK